MNKKLNYFRAQIIDSVFKSGNGHIGGALSCLEIVYSIYKYGMQNPYKNRKKKNRDRFILSKGHACLAQYVVLSHLGFFKKQELNFFRSHKGILEGHPEVKIPGVETVTGSLGIGASFATGVALGLKMQKLNSKVYCIISDGECQEGIIWETAMFAGFKKLNNLTFFLDYNNLQQDGKITDVMNINPIVQKWKSFNWIVKTINGHNLMELKKVLKNRNKYKKPLLIVAKTIKGKGISFMENSLKWHGTKAPTKEEYLKALGELGFNRKLNY